MSRGTAWHLIVAILALIGLILEYRFTTEINHSPFLPRLLIYFSFFTILGNLLVMVMAAGFALGRGWAQRPALRAATTLYIVVVAAVFQLLLAGSFDLSGLDWWGNMLAHQLVPTMWVLGWLACGRHGGIRATTPLLWLIYPAVYGAWTLLHGALTGWYPYAFLSVAKEGMAQVATNMAWMALVFLILSYLVWVIDGRLGRFASRRLP
jgi:hypothetical protein